MEQYDILTLDDGNDYVINKITNYNGKEYFLLIKVDKDENLLDEKLIVEKRLNGKDYVLATIDDDLVYQAVSAIFTKMLLEDLK